MSYNVENLFDSVHDEGKNDYAYMPRSIKDHNPVIQEFCNRETNKFFQDECLFLDWSEKTALGKAENIARMIRSYRAPSGKTGADIVILTEVENLNILRTMIDRFLNDLDYEYVELIEGPDRRGVDIAVMSRIPFDDDRKILLHTNWQKNFTGKDAGMITRGILEIPFVIGGEKLTVFGNHWPAPGHDESVRHVAANALLKLMQRLDPGDNVIALGDFNTVDEESNDTGIARYLVAKNINGYFHDMLMECIAAKNPECTNPPGSQFYGKDKSWSHLDRIFVSDAMLHNPRIKKENLALRIHAPKFATCSRQIRSVDQYTLKYIHLGTMRPIRPLCTNQEVKNYFKFYVNIPWRFDTDRLEGYSDHYPLVLELGIDEE